MCSPAIKAFKSERASATSPIGWREGGLALPEGIAEVVVGGKPVDRYVLACLLHVYDGAQKIVLRARGRHISRACAVAERLRNDYLPDLRYENIRIYTERLRHPKTGRLVRVTCIEITLACGST